MEYYFESAERQARLREVLNVWAGTPFVAGAATAGEGCDCIRFVTSILAGCGVPTGDMDPLPKFHLREGRHREHTRLMEWLHSSAQSKAHLIRSVRDDPARPGDIIACKPHGSLGANHLAIAESAKVFWHCDLSVGVTTLLPSHLHIVAAYRLLDNFSD